MDVVVRLIGSLAYLFLAGYGPAKLFLPLERVRNIWLLVPAIGYTLSVSLFSEITRISGSSSIGMFATLTAVLLINVLSFFLPHRQRAPFLTGPPDAQPNLDERRESLVFGIAAAIVLLAGWSFMVSGWQFHWGSANGDAFDGLRGRDLFISNPHLFFTQRLGFFKSDPLIWYQYSGLSFWTVLLQSPDRMNVLTLNGLVMLFLTPLGVYYLCREGLRLSVKISMSATLLIAMNSFYLATFFAGHVGSIVFGALIPFILGLLLVISRGEKPIAGRLIIFILLCWTLLFTYPHPAPFLVGPVLLYAIAMRYQLIERLRTVTQRVRSSISMGSARLRTLVLVLIALGAFAVAVLYAVQAVWDYFGPMRARTLLGNRAWQISQFKEVWLIYWGLIPAAMPFGLGGYLFRNASTWLAVGYGLVFLYTGIILSGFVAAYRKWREQWPFFLFFACTWLVSFCFMRFVVTDSYYLYKFLYTTQFVWLIVAACAIEFLPAAAFSRNGYLRKVALILPLAAYLSTNAGLAILYGWDSMRRPYNQSERSAYFDLDSVKRYTTPGLFFHYGPGNVHNDHGNVVRYILERSGISTAPADSLFRYQLTVRYFRDVVQSNDDIGQSTTVWSNAVYRIDSTDDRDFLVPVDNKFWMLKDSWYGPESHPDVYGGAPFRWASYRLDFFLINPTNRQHYLNFCVEPGPGLADSPLILSVFLNKKRIDSVNVKGTLAIPVYSDRNDSLVWTSQVRGLQLVSVPLPNIQDSVSVIRLFNPVHGRNFLPWEERFLNYRVSSIALSNRPYSRRTLQLLNGPDDILSPEMWSRIVSATFHGGGSPEFLALIANWDALEGREGSRFRWVENDAQMILANSASSSRFLNVSLERGPGLGTEPAQLTLLVNGNPVDSLDLTSTHSWKVRLPRVLQNENVITLHLNREGKQVGADWRILNFRVFRISLSEQ